MKRILCAVALILALALTCSGCGMLNPAANTDEVLETETGAEETVVEDKTEEADETPATVATAEVGLDVGDMAPDFTVTLLDGTEFKLSDMRGTPVFINFWATWCGYCVQEMPHMQTMHDEYPEIYMIALSLDDSAEDAAAFIEETGYTFDVAFDGAYDAASLYDVSGIPVTVIVGADGTIMFSVVGAMSEDNMRAAVEEATGLCCVVD